MHIWVVTKTPERNFSSDARKTLLFRRLGSRQNFCTTANFFHQIEIILWLVEPIDI